MTDGVSQYVMANLTVTFTLTFDTETESDCEFLVSKSASRLQLLVCPPAPLCLISQMKQPRSGAIEAAVRLKCVVQEPPREAWPSPQRVGFNAGSTEAPSRPGFPA